MWENASRVLHWADCPSVGGGATGTFGDTLQGLGKGGVSTGQERGAHRRSRVAEEPLKAMGEKGSRPGLVFSLSSR
jgi:hypothetical protein